MTTDRALFCAAVALVAAAVPFPAHAQTPPPRAHILNVPYLSQTEALCGGAAAAMVMRFWGASGVYADTFAALVDPNAGGIHGADLVRALQQRGWQALAFEGDLPLLRSHIEKGRPVVALIEDRPGRFHFVVVVGMLADRIIVHDPARAPFRTLDVAAFTRAWGRAGFWALLALPPSDVATDSRALEPLPSTPDSTHESAACDSIVSEGVRLANAGALDEAARVLDLAISTCPGVAAPWRERAGLHALRAEWPAAAADSREALRRDPRDEHAARTLATSLFLEGDLRGALKAWNVAGEPKIDLVRIQGLERTRYAVAAHALGLEPRAMLTSSALGLAERRAAEMPASLVSRVTYRPGDDGSAQVDAVMLERPLVPSGVAALSAIGVRAVTDREVTASIASPTGGGELWTASWRWWQNRPRARLSFIAPATGRLQGVWRVEAFEEKQTYGAGTARVVERQRAAVLQFGDWITPRWRWRAATGLDRWSNRGTSWSLMAETERRDFGDRLSLLASVSGYRGAVDTWTGRAATEWQSRVRNDGGVWLGHAGVDFAGRNAPLALWPGAGTGQARDVLLRAHSLLHDGVIADAVFGRRLVHGGFEWRYWRSPKKRPLRFAPAVFLDTARAWETVAGFDDRMHVDLGGGVRLAVPGAGIVRVDVARGLRDGRTLLSAGWSK